MPHAQPLSLTRKTTHNQQQGANVLEVNNSNNNVILPRTEAVRQAMPTKFSVQPPASDDFSSEDEPDLDVQDRPLTRDELAARSLKILSKKERNRARPHV